jgi:hypothetical protein
MELPGLELLALDAGLQLQALPRTRGAILAVPVQRDKIFIWEPLRTFNGESSDNLRRVSQQWYEHFYRLLYSSPRHIERWKEEKETFN